MASAESDLHQPKPLSRLVTRELGRILVGTGSSLGLRLGLLGHASFVDLRARLVDAGNLAVGAHCQIYAGATIRANGSRHPAVSVGRYGIIRENAFIDAHGGWIDLAEGVFVGQNAVIYGQGGVSVGACTLLSPGVTVISAKHSFDRIDVPIKFQPETFLGISIGSDCWLGAESVVLDGVSIGNGTVVGAGAVVTRDLPAGVVAMGAPARVVRSRPH